MDFLNPSFWRFVAVIAGIYGIMALGFYVQYSLAGLPNFGHVAFMAVAAYGMAILVVRFEAPLLLAALGGLLSAVFLAIVMGAPALRTARRLPRYRYRRGRRDRPLSRAESLEQ